MLSDERPTTIIVNVARSVPSGTVERIWLGFCIGFGLVLGAAAPFAIGSALRSLAGWWS